MSHLLVDALQASGAAQAPQLQHPREGGPHVTAQLLLLPLLAPTFRRPIAYILYRIHCKYIRYTAYI